MQAIFRIFVIGIVQAIFQIHFIFRNSFRYHLLLQHFFNFYDNTKTMNREKVGDFYAHLVNGPNEVNPQLMSSTKLLAGKPTVIHFYDGG